MATFDSARALVAAVMARYRALGAYTDEGQVSMRLGRGEHVLTFDTAADARGNFRFAFRSPHPFAPLRHRVTTHVVGRCTGQAYLYSLTPDGQARREDAASLDLAVAGATGISAGAAHTIACLLYPDVGGWTLAQLKRPRRRAPRWVEGVLCHRVTGLQGRTPVVLDIGVDDLLIRRLTRRKGRVVELRRCIDLQAAYAPDHFLPP